MVLVKRVAFNMNSNNVRPKRQRHFFLGSAILLVVFVAYVCLQFIYPSHMDHRHSTSSSSSSSFTTVYNNNNTNTLIADIQIYTPISTEETMTWKFLDQVDISTRLTKQSNWVTIDQAHLQGSYHVGVWLLVTDLSGQYVLILKRGSQLVTCPNSWSFVGEHAIGNETPNQMVQRGIREELLGSETNGMEQAQKQYNQIVHSIHNLTQHPIFFYRNYGPTNQNRIDRQFTYPYQVQLQYTHEQIVKDGVLDQIFQLDHEVADHQWIHLDKLQSWLQHDLGVYNDFCHNTTIQVMKYGLDSLQQLLLKSHPQQQNHQQDQQQEQ